MATEKPTTLEARAFNSKASPLFIDITDIEETSLSTDNHKFYLNIRIGGKHWYECIKTFHSEVALKSFVHYISALKTLQTPKLLGIEYSFARETVEEYENNHRE